MIHRQTGVTRSQQFCGLAPDVDLVAANGTGVPAELRVERTVTGLLCVRE
jgi:hypothetical protein